jgi:hypothetical protein
MRENTHRPHHHNSQNNFSENRQNHQHHNQSNFSDLLKKEQDHRHKWQDKYLGSSAFSFRLGQIFGIIYNLALLFLVYDLVQAGEKDLALKIFFGNLALIAFALLVTSIERKVLSKKPPRRGGRDRFKGRDRRDDRRDERRDDRRDDRRENRDRNHHQHQH